MELDLSLGDSPAPAKGASMPVLTPTHAGKGEDHELELALGVGTAERTEQDDQKTPTQPEQDMHDQEEDETSFHSESSVKLSLGCPVLPASAEIGSVNSEEHRQFDVNTVLVDGDTIQGRSLSTSSLPMEVLVRQASDQEAAEDEENSGVRGGVRKKLRLSKEQSAFLEDSFKEHSTLTPKQKSDLAKQLNLRPRQVEVWFQNRRARTKLKQTEMDCEYLKRCCETLAQENRRLQRELAELRVLRTTPHPFYGHHLHAAGFSTARVCPSCDNKVTSHYPAITTTSTVVAPPSPVPTLFASPHFGPFTVHPVLRRQPSATS